MKSEGIGSKKLPVKKSIRSKMIKRIRTTRHDSASLVEKNEQEAIKAGGVSRMRRGQSNAAAKVPSGRKVNTRTGPGGKKAMISDGAVESIAADMERRTRRAIKIIGQSRGF